MTEEIPVPVPVTGIPVTFFTGNSVPVNFFDLKFRSGSVPVNFRALKFRSGSGSGKIFDSGRTLNGGSNVWRSKASNVDEPGAEQPGFLNVWRIC